MGNNRRTHSERGYVRNVPQRVMQPEVDDSIPNTSALFSASTIDPKSLNFRSLGINVTGSIGTNSFTTSSTANLLVGCIIRVSSSSGDEYTVIGITNATTFTVSPNLTANYTSQALHLGSVDIWRSYSKTRGYTFAQGTAANQPTYITNSINGKPSLWFKGQSFVGGGNISQYFMVMSDTNSDGFNGDYPNGTKVTDSLCRHMHIVINFNKHAPANGNGAHWSVVGGTGNSVAGTLSLSQTGRTGQANSIKMVNCRGSGISCEVNGSPIVGNSLNTWYVISCEFAYPPSASINNNLIMNGTLSSGTPNDDLIDATLTGMAIGWDWYYGSFEGWIAEIVLTNGNMLSTSQLWKNHNKLRKKYGI